MSEKATVMKMEKIYEKVCGILSTGRVYRRRHADFDEICSEAGIGRVKMDNLLYERFGMSGIDILEAFRKGTL